MADEDDATTMGDNPPIALQQGPLVSVTFQRNPERKQKYLEAQPKALGITLIGLSVYQMSWMSVIIPEVKIPFIIASTVVIIAGILAIAAKTLHIPTLRACLVMQIFAIIASVFNFVIMLPYMEHELFHMCWTYWNHSNGTGEWESTCRQLQHAYSHWFVGGLLVQLTLVAISVTLAAYCCKVVNCCSPESKMPVITVQARPESNPSALE